MPVPTSTIAAAASGNGGGGGKRSRVCVALASVILAAIVCVIAGVSLLQRTAPPTVLISGVGQPPRSKGKTRPPRLGTSRSEVLNATARPQPGDDHPSVSPPPRLLLGGAAGEADWTLVEKVSDIEPGAFYRLQDVHSGRWLARALDTNAETSGEVEKVFRIYHADPKKYGKWLAVKGHTRMHLTREFNDKVTVDRPWARGYEQWKFVEADLPKSLTEAPEAAATLGKVAKKGRGGAGGKVFLLKSLPRHDPPENHVVAQSRRDAMGLVTTTPSSKRNPVYWRLYRVKACTDEDTCWGPEVQFGGGGSAPSLSSSPPSAILTRLARLGPFPIIGSPKPLSHAQLDLVPKDAFDAVRISSRTLMNWASLPGMQSLQLTDDKNTQLVIDQLNQMVEKRRVNRQRGSDLCQVPVNITKRSVRFEMMPKFNNQPTYRGVFKRGLEEFPQARCVMFSNGDILYTPSLTQTLERVLQFLDDKAAAMKRAGKAWHDRWMVVGQRTNFDIPAAWSPLTTAGATGGCNSHGLPSWVSDVERFAASGEKFQSNAEDYFIVSRAMFNWNDIPDFIVGGVAFDNWIVNKGNEMARRGEAVVIDATKTVTALHQNHHAVDPKISHGTPKSVYNSHLAHDNGGVGNEGHTADATVATERLADGSITVYDKHRLLFL